MSPGAQIRALAARVVWQVLEQRQSLKPVLAAARSEIDDPRDRALLEAVSYSVIRHKRSLDFAASRLLQKALPRDDAITQCLLLVGLAQLHLMKLPEHAAVSATVDAARLLGKAPRAALINAILRRSLREGLAVSDDFAVQNDHPEWLVKQLQADWPGHWRDIVLANNRQAPLWIRINGQRTSRAAYAVLLEQSGIAFTPGTLNGQGILIDPPMMPTRLPGWQEGLLAVQDQSAQLAGEALEINAGMTVLDMCAAPGGKSAQLAERHPALLVLLDIVPERLKPIDELLQRQGLAGDKIVLHACDATQALPEGLPLLFDAVLLDAPCSATGIIRRQPDIKWHRQFKDIDQLNTLQWRLLKNAWRCLKPGGRLMYSTCSVLKAENERLMDSFLKQNSDACAIDLGDRYGRVSGAGRQRFPGEDGGDGFYYALLQKA
ncbi:MAG TPA: 16S rRNA (cytosine(967)-C(5))-methyltransferase RsmB [Arenimonas sp.]|nr:16S rRNA (cytosine(967)-C(5))-methyltransferase RsmB [Arenimonas sp.]